jgi:hypothetical protein
MLLVWWKGVCFMETIIASSTLDAFRAGLRGASYAPGEAGYDEARKAWNLNAYQHPALVVMAAGAADVADFLVRQLTDDAFVHKTPAIGY